MQLPPVQIWPPVQAFPQPPQLLTSVRRLTQVPLQVVWPSGHVATTHTPLRQKLFAAQTVPQPPQLFGSIEVSTQWPLQTT